jgi:hypothetical protein
MFPAFEYGVVIYSYTKTGTQSVAVNCLSGRGRTGTFSAVVLGELKKVSTHSELVDIIVGMRENRDGLVETPAQFRYASLLLGLPDTKYCGAQCNPAKNVDSFITPVVLLPFLGGFIFSLIVMTVFIFSYKNMIFKRNLFNFDSSLSRDNPSRHPPRSQSANDTESIENDDLLGNKINWS